MSMALSIRRAVYGDLGVINDIYNYYVLNSTCTYQTEPEAMSAREAWFAAHGAGHPVIVAEYGGRVCGWGALSRFHPRAAYRHTVEDSVYVHHEMQGRGVGSALLAALVDYADGEGGHRSIVGIISADQSVSVRLHEKFGFAEVGRIKDAGQKFGRWLDVVYMQKML